MSVDLTDDRIEIARLRGVMQRVARDLGSGNFELAEVVNEILSALLEDPEPPPCQVEEFAPGESIDISIPPMMEIKQHLQKTFGLANAVIVSDREQRHLAVKILDGVEGLLEAIQEAKPIGGTDGVMA